MRNIISSVYLATAWFFSLGNKIFRVAPVLTGALVVLTIASQLLLLVGFLLPLKVILLLGSEMIPVYFPSFMAEFGRELLIVLLSAASALFYLSHLICDGVVNRLSDQGAEQLVQRSRKITIFERQDEIASKGYLRFSQAFAGLCFTGLCLFGMLFFYLKLALLISAYFVIVTVFVVFLCARSSSFREKLADRLGSFPKVGGGVGFLLTFSFIVVDYLFFEPVGVLVAVISLLLSRQIFNKTASLIKDVAELYQQQSMLRALFFHAHVFLPEKKKSGFAEIVEISGRHKWMLESLSSIMDTQGVRFSSRWVSLGAPELLCFIADIVTGEGAERQILFKIFDAKRRSQAMHEASLLTQQRGLHVPEFLGATTVAGMNCHLFEITNYSVLVSDAENPWAARVAAFREDVLAVVPAPSLVSSYLRSMPHLGGRLDGQGVDYLYHLYEGDRDLAPLVQFRALLPAITQVLGELPLALQLPDIRPNMLWLDPEGNPCLLHWGRWELEPVGVKWPHNTKMVETSLERLKEMRVELAELSLNKVHLAALCSGYEASQLRGRYDRSFHLVSVILAVYAKL